MDIHEKIKNNFYALFQVAKTRFIRQKIIISELYSIIFNIKCQFYIINIIEECAKKIQEDNITEVALLASEGTILSKVYDEIFSTYNINIISPTKNEFSEIREFIEAVKQNNISNEIKKKFIEYTENINCDSLILGCTELPVLYKVCKNDISKKIFDPLQCAIDVLKK